MRYLFPIFLYCSFVHLICLQSFAAERRKIGVIAPLTGPNAAWGQDVRNTLLFAHEQFGDGGFEFIFEDDQCLGKSAVTAAKKLLFVDKIDYAIVVCTESTLATAQLFEQSRTLAFAVAASGAGISQAGEYIFRTWPSDAQASAILAREMGKRVTNAGVLTEERGFSVEYEDSFMKAADNLKVTAIHFDSDQTEFRSLLLRLKQQRIDGLFINTGSERLFATILKQTHELGIQVPIFGAYIPGNKEFIELAGHAANGITYVDAPAASAFSKQGQILFARFLERFGTTYSSQFAFGATFEALRRLQSLTGDKEADKENLLRSEFDGIFGKYSFDENGDIVGVPHRVITLQVE